MQAEAPNAGFCFSKHVTLHFYCGLRSSIQNTQQHIMSSLKSASLNHPQFLLHSLTRPVTGSHEAPHTTHGTDIAQVTKRPSPQSDDELALRHTPKRRRLLGSFTELESTAHPFPPPLADQKSEECGKPIHAPAEALGLSCHTIPANRLWCTNRSARILRVDPREKLVGASELKRLDCPVVYAHHHEAWIDGAWFPLDADADALLNLVHASRTLFTAHVVLRLNGRAPLMFAAHIMIHMLIETETDMRCPLRWVDPATGRHVEGRCRDILLGSCPGLPAAERTTATQELVIHSAFLSSPDVVSQVPALRPAGGESMCVTPTPGFLLVCPGSDEWNRVLGHGGVASALRRSGVALQLHRVVVPRRRAVVFDATRQCMEAETGLKDGGEVLVWHGTQAKNLPSICMNGFLTSCRVKHGRRFGDGTYFAAHEWASLAMQYSCRSNQSAQRVGCVLLVRFLAGVAEHSVRGQREPTSPAAHCGVDHMPPMRFVAWGADVNTRTRPIYAVTFVWRPHALAFHSDATAKK